MMRDRRSALLALFVLATAVCAVPVSAQELPRTFQEQNQFKAGPTPFTPLMDYWYDLARLRPEVSIRPLTATLLDRELTLVVVSKDGITTPEDAIRSGRTIVLIASSVHGGETSPKEAAQLVARDLVAGDLRSALDDVIVLFVPVLNPDGGEVRRRTNEEGFDLNRDYIKLESQEIQAIVTQIVNQWTPDIFVDGHHGGAVPYTITWQGSLNPAVDADLRAYPYANIFPRIREALRAEDYDGFDYSGAQVVDGVPGWGSTSVEARKHHVYTGLQNTIGILLETPGNTRRLRANGTKIEEVPQEERYAHQVRGQYIAQKTIVRVAAEKRQEIRALTTGARLRTIQNGATFNTGDQVVLEYKLVSRGKEQVWVPDKEAPLGYKPEMRDIFLKYDPTKTTPRPLGYVLPPSMAKVLPLLFDHGIVVHRFAKPAKIDLEVYYATDVQRKEYFQGHDLKAVTVEKATESVEVPAGSYYISTAQSRGNLIAYLMEPESDDNLITWGFADHLLRVPGVAPTDDESPRPPAAAQQAAQARRQRVPMMRLVTEQPLPVIEAVPFNRYDRNRYYQVW